MHIVYTQIHTKSVHTQLQSVQKTTICYIFKDNKYNITMCPIEKKDFQVLIIIIYLSFAQLYIIVLLSSRKHFQLHDPLMRNPPANPYSP